MWVDSCPRLCTVRGHDPACVHATGVPGCRAMSAMQVLTDALLHVEQVLVSAWETPGGKAVLAGVAVSGCAAAIYFGWKRRTHITPGSVRRTCAHVALTLIAACIAWSVAGLLGATATTFAAAAAVVSVQLGLAWSVTTALSVIVPTVGGLISAQLAITVGFDGLGAILVAAGVALAVGRMFGLDPERAAGVAATAVFASSLGDLLTETTVVDRVVCTTLGAFIGVVCAAIPLGGSPVRVASRQVDEVSLQVAAVWAQAAATVRAALTYSDAAKLLAASRDLFDVVDRANEVVEAGLGHARWSLLTDAQDEVGALATRWTMVRHGVEQVNSVSRVLFDAVGTDAAEQLSASPLVADALAAAGDVFTTLSVPLSGDRSVQNAASMVESVAVSAASTMKSSADTSAMLLGGSVLSGARQVAFGAFGSDAVASDKPELDDVMPNLKKLRKRVEKPSTT